MSNDKVPKAPDVASETSKAPEASPSATSWMRYVHRALVWGVLTAGTLYLTFSYASRETGTAYFHSSEDGDLAKATRVFVDEATGEETVVTFHMDNDDIRLEVNGESFVGTVNVRPLITKIRKERQDIVVDLQLGSNLTLPGKTMSDLGKAAKNDPSEYIALECEYKLAGPVCLTPNIHPKGTTVIMLKRANKKSGGVLVQ